MSSAVSRRGGADPFADHSQLMKELYHEYQKKDDLDSIAMVEALIQGAVQAAQAKETSAQGLIMDLSKNVKELEVLSTYPEAEGAHVKRIAMLQAQRDLATNETERLRLELRQLEEMDRALVSRREHAAKSREQTDRYTAEEEPILRYQLSLFAHISNISWALDREDRVAGTVSHAQTGDLRPFDLAAAKMDEHTLVNELWKLI